MEDRPVTRAAAREASKRARLGPAEVAGGLAGFSVGLAAVSSRVGDENSARFKIFPDFSPVTVRPRPVDALSAAEEHFAFRRGPP